MKNLVLYILLVFAFTNCSSEKILSEKINNKKWDINYLNNNVISESIINNTKDEVLNLTHNKPNNLFQETEQLFASNNEIIDDKKHKISPINLINIKQKLFVENSKVISKSNQKENIVSKHISKNDLKYDKESIRRLSNYSILLNMLGFIVFVFGVGGLSFISYVVASVLFLFGFLFNIIAIKKIKKIKEKIKNQMPTVKQNIIISLVISTLVLIGGITFMIVVSSLSGIGGYGGPW
tara:strand:+ start:1074 stop:1784 length:711 start_codon:yes stop_codon:yes gene_type:complete